MTIAHDFAYYKPHNFDEALQLLAEHKDKTQILAGGTDLIVWLKEDWIKPDVIVDIKGISGLNKITSKKGTLEIGALVTFSDLLASDVIKTHYPLMQEMAAQVASVGIRNRATLAGNICAASPACDSGPIMLVCDANIVVRSVKGERVIPIDKWFVGPRKTALQPGEMVTKFSFTPPKEKVTSCYLKLRRLRGEDLAQASVAIFAHKKTYKIAFGAVAPTPIRAPHMEALLEHQDISEHLIEKLLAMVPATIKPICDIRSTKEYRTHMIKIMLERGLKQIKEILK